MATSVWLKPGVGWRVPSRWLWCVGLASLMAGCGSPPSAVPLMRAVRQALADEAEAVETADAARDRRHLDRLRADLREAYRADLDEAEALTPAWIDEATVVYVAAREALLRHELELENRRAIRAENLRLAARAQTQAIANLEHQDRLLATFGLDLWRLPVPQPESSR
ncbi:MAG: hypothetical protein AAFX76_02070 [Planctomycetota bacterium]